MTKEPTPPADQAIRDQALGPLEGFHLEAPAGSGKTSVLLARFLTLLARVDTPEEMLALTFTRKAAGELRARVMALLWERQAPGPDASPLELRLRELAAAVFRRHGDEAQLKLTPERLPIMTFHGFGAQLLKLAPQEAGVPLEFTLLEEDEARWLKVEALDEMRRRLNRRAPPATRCARPSYGDWCASTTTGGAWLKSCPGCCPGGTAWEISWIWPGSAGMRPPIGSSWKNGSGWCCSRPWKSYGPPWLAAPWERSGQGFGGNCRARLMATLSFLSCPARRICRPGKPCLKFCSPSREIPANDSPPKTGSTRALTKKNGLP